MAESFTIVTPTTQTASAGFAVSGAIQGYTTAPTLNYREDAGSWLALPIGFSVSATAFTFTNPGLAAGSHTVSVRDANNTAVEVSTGTFSVAAGATPVITVTAPSLPAPGDSFTLSGPLTNYASAPTLTYADDSGVPQALPTGDTVTTTSFAFLHPPTTAGSHTTVISDGTNAGSSTYSVTAIIGGASANLTTIAPATGFFVDNSSNRWTITTGGQVAVNGVVDATTSNVVEMAWITAVIWYENSSGLWFSKTAAAQPWSAGTIVSPLANLPTITVNAIASETPNVAFTVTGSLVNYSAAPMLNYSDNGGLAHAFPTGSTVSAATFSFIHPAMPTGLDTVSVSDGTYSGSATYTVVTPGWTVLPSTTNLFDTITGLAPITAYDIEIYAQNSIGQGPPSAILTATTAAVPIVVPGPPLALIETGATQTVMNLSWSAPLTGTLPFTYQTQWQLALVSWQPVGAAAPLIFSNSNLTATASGTSGNGTQPQVCVSTTSITSTSGFRMFEVTAPTLTLDWACGIANPNVQTAGDGLGSDANSVAFYPQYNQATYCGGSDLNQSTFPSSNGEVVSCVIDPSVPQIWFSTTAMRGAGHTWNNSSTANPATNTGGQSLVGHLTTGVYSAVFYDGESGGVATFNGGSSPFTVPLPAGVVPWNNWANGPMVSGTTAQISGLVMSTSYQFQVDATNSAGTGPYSAMLTASTGATPAPTITWQPSGAAPPLTFSNGNLTATAGGSATVGAQPQTCFSTTSITSTSGFRQFEVTIVDTSLIWSVGIANQFAAVVGIGLGGDNTSCAFIPEFGQAIYCGSETAINQGSGGSAAGEVVTCVFDPSVPQIWFTTPSMRTAGFTWNNTATADPSRNIGGQSLAGLLTPGTYSIAFYCGEAGGVATLNAGSSAFSVPMPANCQTWAGGLGVIVAPNAATLLVAGTPSNTAIGLSWAVPTIGTLPLTYNVMVSPHGLAQYTEATSTMATSVDVTNLTPNTAYDFLVFATNSGGTGGNSNVATATTGGAVTVPGAPSGVAVTATTAVGFTLTWQLPTQGGVPTGYQVQYKLTTDNAYTNFGTTTAALTQTITGLTASTAYSLQVLAFNSAGSSGPSSPPVTATTTAPVSAAPRVIAFLKSITGTHVLSGQFIERGADPTNGYAAIQTIQAQTGKWLALIGGDYYYYNSPGPVDTTFNSYAIPYWNAGGLITLTTTMPNPASGKGAADTSFVDPVGIITPGTPTNAAFIATIGQVANGLKALQTAGVAVILRPFHENNGNWFWWGTENFTAAQFIALWQYYYNYMTITSGLKNIVWLYGANGDFADFPIRYPGNSMVDIVGYDLYTDFPASDTADYNAMVALGKPVCMSEFGPGGPSAGDATFHETTLITALSGTLPNVTFYQQWWAANSGGIGWSMANTFSWADVSTALHNPWVLNRGDFTF
jgi:mannan endo-1,4-beta-mannosidase